jgi:hypothetical protein
VARAGPDRARRGGRRGLGALDAHQSGFFPIFELDGTLGGALEYGSGPAFTLGGRASKSLSFAASVGRGTGTRTYGIDFLSMTFAAEERWSSVPRTTRWGSGLQMCTVAYDEF